MWHKLVEMHFKSYCGPQQPQPLSAASLSLCLSWDFLPQSHELSQPLEKSLSCKLVFSLSFRGAAISGITTVSMATPAHK